MNYLTKSKWSGLAFVVLILMNITTLAALWWMSNIKAERKPPQGGAIPYLIKELQLDSIQQIKIIALRDEHRAEAQVLRRKNRESKDAFFDLIQQEGISETTINEAASNSVRYDAELAKVTFTHFKKIRAICTPAQQHKFDEIIHEVLRMQAGPQGPPPHRDGRPPGEQERGDKPPGQNGPPPPRN